MNGLIIIKFSKGDSRLQTNNNNNLRVHCYCVTTCYYSPIEVTIKYEIGTSLKVLQLNYNYTCTLRSIVRMWKDIELYQDRVTMSIPIKQGK